ncbi:MAG: AAA family ATPase [Blastocatellia bacterium]
MIRQHLKDSLHWLHLFCFKLRTFRREAEKLSRWQAVAVFLKIYPWLWLGGLVLVCVIGLASEAAGYEFRWQPALLAVAKIGLVVGLGGGLGIGLGSRLVAGLGGGLVAGLGGGLVVGLDGGLGIGLGIGLFFGLVFGLVDVLDDVLVFGLDGMLGIGLFFGLFFGLVFGLFGGLFFGLDGGLSEAAQFAATYFPIYLTTFTVVYGRPYHWPIYLAQYWRARRSCQWLTRFRQSPVHWDETIGLPLPWLSNWLFEIAKSDRKEGLAEVLWVAAERPFQRKPAQKALLKLAAYDLRQLTTVTQLAQVDKALAFLPDDEELAPVGIQTAAARMTKLAALAQDYLLRHTPKGQHQALLELQSELQTFQQAMALLPAPTGSELQQVAAQWQATVNAAEAELRARLPFENPFIAGNPLKEHEENLFKGRRDLVVKLEEAIFTQRPSLLLYGRRRTGKTSALLNLPRLMSSQFVPVFINCQNQKFSDSDAMFCYHLTRALHNELVKRKLAEGLAQPDKSEFVQHAFTRLDEWLDELEAHSRRIHKQILLTFDEYERLAEGIRDGKLTRAVLNQIRAIVQHRERLLVLFSGSHRFEEMTDINWSDYLINVQTLHLSFLARDEARELLEHPTPEFALGYAPGVVDRVLDLTHGQPYLVQALGSELVNTINSQQRKEAALADLDVAIQRVLGMADAYFENNWRDCNAAEQTVLLGLATQQANGLSPAEQQAALLGLNRKELIEPHGEHWQFTVELFRLWVKQEKAAAVTALLPA